ncbi:reverse transcriptase domain-containing protein [Spirillospora sp. NPDC046719]
MDADSAAAFDRIDHQQLLDQLGLFPARDQVTQWLRAGVMENGRFAPTWEGTPQGGVLSPCQLNVALQGMEHAAGARYSTKPSHKGWSVPGTPMVIRYADDLVVLCHSRQEAEQVKAQLAAWLEPRGLVLNEDKTRIVRLDEGFDFLGFNIRHYPSGKLLIKPDKAAVKRFRTRLRTEVRRLYGANASVIGKLNPVLRGWAAYYRTAVSKQTFASIDHTLWWTLTRWPSIGTRTSRRHEPCAVTSGTHGSEGAPARQRAGAYPAARPRRQAARSICSRPSITPRDRSNCRQPVAATLQALCGPPHR